MKNKKRTILIWIAVVVLVLLVMALDWAITCGAVKLITMCFGWQFSWSWATGIWLIKLFFMPKPRKEK